MPNKHRSVRQLALAAASAVGLLLAGPSLAEAGDPAIGAARSSAESLVDRVLAELAKTGVGDDAKIKSLEKIVFGRFDFPTISRLVLARNFKKFSKAQQQEFEDQFKVYLSRSYGRRLLRYANEKVEFRDARVEPRGDVTVMTMIVGGAADGIDMNYRMRNRKDDWKVIDVVIEGISLISNFRTQFKDIISRDGPDGLLAKLRDKTFELPDPEPESSSAASQ
ncbi:MAG: ABC transporter substrate-binding protein [bacterium]|nr:ABC transporter substrate-binding protein [bacterium]MCP5042584.1 ABC transporter substrate-binding protein [bacterium]